MTDINVSEELEVLNSKRPTLSDTLNSLVDFRDQDKGLGQPILYGLSALTSREVEQLKPVWETFKAYQRRRVLRELVSLSETDFEMDYRAIGLFGIQDKDPRVRVSAIEVLWEDESLELLSELIRLIQNDDNSDVRAAALSGLGRYILLGELGELPNDDFDRAQNVVIDVLNEAKAIPSVKRRALEAIANCSNRVVPKHITEAYENGIHELKVSAVFAMGRTCDERWSDIILDELDSLEPEIRYEAVRASGELELEEAVHKIARLAIEDEDREIKEAAIWSLGETGGREALRVLEALLESAEEADDIELTEALEDAIGNASLVMGEAFTFPIDNSDYGESD